MHAKAVLDLPIRAVAIDTGGHHTKAAYEFCRTRLVRRVWAIKGRGGTGVPVWPRRPTRTNKGKIPLFIVGVDAIKDALLARLKLSEPGPGAVHFPRSLDAEYFRQLRRYFRMHMIGYFEGIGSERGIAWRCSDSLSLRAFLRLANRDKVPDSRPSVSQWCCRELPPISTTLWNLSVMCCTALQYAGQQERPPESGLSV